MNVVEEVSIGLTIVLVLKSFLFQPDNVSVITFDLTAQNFWNAIDFFMAIVWVLIQFVDIRSFLDAETVVDFDVWSKKYHINELNLLIVLVNLFLQHMF